MRALADDDGKRVKLVWGAVTLLVWSGLFWACWLALDWCDDQIPQWASYLNSKVSAGGRSMVFTWAHIARWLTIAEWILRWIIVPGKDHSVLGGLGAVGLADSISQSVSRAAGLALVARGHRGCAGGRGAACAFLRRSSAWNRVSTDLGSCVEADCDVCAGDRQLGFAARMGRCAAGSKRTGCG